MMKENILLSFIADKNLALFNFLEPDYETIHSKRADLYQQYVDKIFTNPNLTRAMVSFQANKSYPFFRWLKFKEAFSANFVSYILGKFEHSPETSLRILDPFAGVGTTLTNAIKKGHYAIGIELLPVGIATIQARQIADRVDTESFKKYLRRLESLNLYSFQSSDFFFPHLRITERAFSIETEKALSAYTTFLNKIKTKDVRDLFRFACLAILEEVSYTRKDGQYLRWDYRSGKALKSKFNKGKILEFKPAIIRKLREILEDINNRDSVTCSNNFEIIEGSCLSELPRFPDNYIDLVITSPPYCNRYDYTRTYALELAFLGLKEIDVKQLRQTLLSATVENKTKRLQLAYEYKKRKQENRYKLIENAFFKQQALHEILKLLEKARDEGKLNNNNIPEMVKNYFYEMNFVIHELSRVLAPNGYIIMVNDNVQYNGEEIPVDLILSDFALSSGLNVEQIWVLPKGKGNSSQQMGNHGRKELRKCVYIWSKQSCE